MGKSGPSPPPIADPGGVAAGQFVSNLAAGESSQAGSQVNQITPTGALTYYQTGVGPNGVPTYTAIQNLTPEQQQLLNEQQLGFGLAGGAGGNMFANSFGQYSSPQNLGANAGGLTQGLLGLETSYLNPYFTQQSSQLDTNLRNQGLMPGSDAYNNQMLNLSREQNNAVTGFLASAEPAAFQQTMQQYLTPLQVGQTLLGIDQPGMVNAPYTGQPPGYQPPDVIGAVSASEAAANQQYQAQLQQQSAMMQGIMSLVGAGIGAISDRRLKRDIKRVGCFKNLGINIYKWRYLWGNTFYVGPMAQDVQRQFPDMVTTINGYLAFKVT